MNSNKSSSPDEIDISHLFHWIGSGFSRLGRLLIQGLAMLRSQFISHYILFSVAITSGLILGISYSKVIEKKSYTSSMIISCEYLNMRIIENTIDKLNLLCLEKEREGLAEVLNIDLATAKNIIAFRAKNFISENDRVEIEVLKEQLANVASDKKDLVNKIMGKIEIGNEHSYQLSVDVYNPEIVKALESALVHYFKSNEYVQKRIKSNEAKLLARKEKLLRESKKLDSLKYVVYENMQSMAKQSREGSNNVILSDKYMTDPLNIFKEDLIINHEIQEINTRLFIKPDFEIVDNLTTFREPNNFSLSKIMLFSFLGSIAVGYSLLGLLKFNAYLARVDSTVRLAE